ncbi:MAG: hypothetical protein LZF62_480219 [Nitrospira sp.]|nr:MAG: hypothetical protein LZF62_480219 [Nitrospira sp.]
MVGVLAGPAGATLVESQHWQADFGWPVSVPQHQVDERKNLFNEQSWSKPERLPCVSETQHVCLVNPSFLDSSFP